MSAKSLKPYNVKTLDVEKYLHRLINATSDIRFQKIMQIYRAINTHRHSEIR